jgi:FkbM family methyltransferase
MPDWRFLISKRIIRRRYAFGRIWTFDTGLDAAGTEDFNDPIIFSPSKGDFIDGGAAWGYWTIRGAGYYRSVVAVEPDPKLIGTLSRNVSLNHLDNVIVANLALGAEDGETSFFRYSAGESSLIKEHMGQVSQGVTSVNVSTIDRLVAIHRLSPSLIKLDVEGAEADVIKGARNTIERFHPTLLIEVHSPVTPEEIISLLPSYTWTTRWRYLNRSIYPMERQPHLWGQFAD